MSTSPPNGWLGLEIGSWAEWAGAIGTFAAVLVALGFPIYERVSRRRANRLAQARAVQVAYDYVNLWDPSENAMVAGAEIIVTNSTSDALYDVRIIVLDSDSELRAIESRDPVNILAGERHKFQLRVPQVDYTAHRVVPNVAVEFGDARRQRWRRTFDGKLIKWEWGAM